MVLGGRMIDHKWRDVSSDFGLDPKSILRKKKLERILNES